MNNIVMQLINGNLVNLSKLEEFEWGIVELVHAISNLARYNGHTRSFYSVAQHSVLVSYVVPPEKALAGLCHDLSEAIVGDIISPIKRHMGSFVELEAAVVRQICSRIGHFTPEDLIDPEVMFADSCICLNEKRDLMNAPQQWPSFEGKMPYDIPTIEPMCPEEAFDYFMARYCELTGETHEHRYHEEMFVMPTTSTPKPKVTKPVADLSKRFWVFGSEAYEVSGGMSDFVGAFQTKGPAEKLASEYQWGYVFDSKTGKQYRFTDGERDSDLPERVLS